LLSSLDSYNKYLMRKIKFGIKNINKIYSDILIQTDTKRKDEIIKSICQHLGEDRLKLANYLSILYKVPETEQFLVKESYLQKLKTIGCISSSRNSSRDFDNSFSFKTWVVLWSCCSVCMNPIELLLDSVQRYSYE
jgi:hypothetical protein